MKKILKRFTEGTYNDSVCNEIESKLISLLKQSDTIHVALSGGNTPLPILKLLAERKMNWNKIQFYLVDERCVQYDSEQCNFMNLKMVFFDKISSRVFPMTFNDENYEKASFIYNQVIDDLPKKNGIPQFDLILLGMGNDGHTASLFPHTKALEERNAWVVLNEVPQMASLRMTITFPVILNAKSICVLCKGEDKNKIIDNLYSKQPRNYPMLKIVEERDNLNWFTT